MCKAISERLVTSQAINESSTKFLAVRYGNVLESRGSILPLFRYQVENSDYITVTNPDMTRFLMTLDDSVNLIQCALDNGNSGETWIPQLHAMRIGDLAQIFADRYNKSVKITGLRPGEKMNEDLINESESIRTTQIENHYVIGPAYNAGGGSTFTYHSGQSVMTRRQLESHLTNLGVLSMQLNDFPRGASIEEIRIN
jgi:UDP-glucose 4-epimerase